MLILGIDPGPAEHGWALVDTDRWKLWGCGSVAHVKCDQAFDFLNHLSLGITPEGIAIECPEALYMPLSQDLLSTIRNEHDLARMFPWAHRIGRKEVKVELLGRTSVNETAVNGAIRDRWAARFGIPEKELKGTKKKPGPLYGVGNHVWPALGVIEVLASRLAQE